MASLYEMMAAAEHKAQNKAAANPMQSGAAALAGGFTKGFDTRFGNESAADLQTKQLQQAMAILQQKEQVEKLKRQALSDKFLRHALIEAGYDWPELRQGENNELGKSDVSMRDQANTNAGTVGDIVSGKGKEVSQRKLVIEHKGDKLNVVQPKEKSVSAQDKYREDVNRARRGEITWDQLKDMYPDKAVYDHKNEKSTSVIDKTRSSLPDLRERQIPLNPKFQEDFGIMGRVRSWLDENRAVLNPATRETIENDLKTPDDLINLIHKRQQGTLQKNVDFKAILEAFGISQKHLENGNFPPEVKTVSQAIEYLVRTR